MSRHTLSVAPQLVEVVLVQRVEMLERRHLHLGGHLLLIGRRDQEPPTAVLICCAMSRWCWTSGSAACAALRKFPSPPVAA
jgi:hypothetical protein